MTEQEAAELDRWAEDCHARSEIEDFLDWLPGSGRGSVHWKQGTRAAALDEYFGVNRSVLESARRKLLAEVRGGEAQP